MVVGEYWGVSELQPKKVYVKTAQNVLSRKMFKSM
jgi:hypothetical protein